MFLAMPASAALDAAPAGKAAAPWMPAVKAKEARLTAQAMNRTLLILLLPAKEAKTYSRCRLASSRQFNLQLAIINNTLPHLFYN
jgi:hypothetical protein